MSDFTVLSHEECARIRADLSHAIEANALLIAENRRLKEALELIRDSNSFNGGTFVSELQGIAKRALQK